MILHPLLNLVIGLAAVAIAVLCFWPNGGWIGRRHQSMKLQERVMTEDALKHICKHELSGQGATIESVAGQLGIGTERATLLLERMEENDLVVPSGETLALTAAGRTTAYHVIRAHRLWERMLADTTGFEEASWHRMADEQEHRLSPAETERLAARLGNPTLDPHGDPIPDEVGGPLFREGQPLNRMPPRSRARIVHIEDEPEAVYAQLLAEGLYPGQVIDITDVTPKRISFWCGGEEHMLASLVAANITVEAIEAQGPVQPVVEIGVPLDKLHPGESGRVLGVSPRCRGAERRRLLDLGILPGALVVAEMSSPLRDPVAYRIRGALIALRREQANFINVERVA